MDTLLYLYHGLKIYCSINIYSSSTFVVGPHYHYHHHYDLHSTDANRRRAYKMIISGWEIHILTSIP